MVSSPRSYVKLSLGWLVSKVLNRQLQGTVAAGLAHATFERPPIAARPLRGGFHRAAQRIVSAQDAMIGATTLKTNHILIDYENVQPTAIALPRDGRFKVKVFLGANQTKIPVTLASAIQALGTNAEYVAIESSGSNALDFLVAYYIGAISAHEPSAFFHIISKDTGFDPLIKHLKTKGIVVQRSASIAAISLSKPSCSVTSDAQIETAVAHLAKMKTAKPRAQKTLLSTLRALFRNGLTEDHLASLFAALCERGIVKLEGTKVSYELPEP